MCYRLGEGSRGRTAGKLAASRALLTPKTASESPETVGVRRRRTSDNVGTIHRGMLESAGGTRGVLAVALARLSAFRIISTIEHTKENVNCVISG